MDRETFLMPSQLAKVTGITQKQLELQLTRVGAAVDASPESSGIPITRPEKGRHARYTFGDALTLACVSQLLRCGLGFGDALPLVKFAGLNSFASWRQEEQGDLWLAAWSEAEGDRAKSMRHVFGSFRNVSGALPADRMVTVSLNISQVSRVLEVELRLIGMERRGSKLVYPETLL